MLVYPRLDDATASSLLLEYSGKEPAELIRCSGLSHPRSHWYATGAERASEDVLAEIRTSLRELASAQGYPKRPRARDTSYIRFDQLAGGVLHRGMAIVTADAADEGVWSFLSLVVAPDVAFWRWPNTGMRDDYERILGRPRNVFRRLWWRAEVLGSAADDPNASLREDEAVAIMERPTFGGDRRLARSIAVAHLDWVKRNPRLSRTELLRDAMKRFRRLTPFVALGALPDDELRDLIDGVFLASCRAMTPSG
jgi:hypothetical protein